MLRRRFELQSLAWYPTKTQVMNAYCQCDMNCQYGTKHSTCTNVNVSVVGTDMHCPHFILRLFIFRVHDYMSVSLCVRQRKL